MNVKLLLAESLDTLRRGEEREAATDRLCEQMSKRSASERNFGAVRKEYSVAYDIFIKGLEMINHCRRTAMNVKDDEMVRFCTDKMNTYMDRCEKIRAKEGNILMSVAQVEATGGMDKDGYDVGETLFFHDAHKTIKGGAPINYEGSIGDGAYQLLVKNHDDYAVAAPVIQVALQVTAASGKVQTFRKTIPSKCAWSRYIGVVDSATVKLIVASDAWMRQSAVEVNFRRLVPTDDKDFATKSGGATTKKGPSQHWVDSLPPIPNMDDLLPPPGAPVEGVPIPSPTDDEAADLLRPVPSQPIDGVKSVQSDDEDEEAAEVRQLNELSGMLVPHVTATVPAKPASAAPPKPQPPPEIRRPDYIKPMLNPPVDLRQRLEMVSVLVAQFPTAGVSAVPLNRAEREFLHSIQSLPIPTHIDFDGIDFGEIELADLGDEIADDE